MIDWSEVIITLKAVDDLLTILTDSKDIECHNLISVVAYDYTTTVNSVINLIEKEKIND